MNFCSGHQKTGIRRSALLNQATMEIVGFEDLAQIHDTVFEIGAATAVVISRLSAVAAGWQVSG